MRRTPAPPQARRRWSVPRSRLLLELHHIVQRLLGGFEETPHAARGLADALLVLDQGEADEIVAVLAEADPRRDRDVGLLDQELREFEAPEMAEALRHRRPGEHRGAGLVDRPASGGEAFDHHVAAALVG